MANFLNKNDKKNVPKNLSIAFGSKFFGCRPLRSIISKKWERKGTGVQVASFLIKTIALETVRRFSRANCPVLWTGLQGLQVLCFPPLKWIQCWKPFGFFVRAIQMMSRPLLILSIVDAFSDESGCSNFHLDDIENSPSTDDSEIGSENLSGSTSLQHIQSMRIGDENRQGPLSTDWMNHLSEELAKQGITLPERINNKEVQRFYVAANGDFPTLVGSVKKTIHWRESYRILSGEELQLWSNMIFWHGLDVCGRPCLIVRLGHASAHLPTHHTPRFAQALVSQVEHGILHLVGGEYPQITVLVDCQGLSPLRFPMQTMRYCCNILQDHFPNVLGCLLVIRLPSVVRVIAQTFIQVLKPSTKQKVRIMEEPYQRALSEYFQSLPSYIGGLCNCTRCATFDECDLFPYSTTITESVSNIVNDGDFLSVESIYQYDMMMENHCSRTLRTAVIGMLIIWVVIAFIHGIYDPESRPIFLL